MINDISGLKYDEKMPQVLEKYTPSLIVCAYSHKLIKGNTISQTKKLLNDSIKIAQKAKIMLSSKNMVQS